MPPITRIVTHRFPDLDALLCCWLLLRHGEERYPGISGAEIEYWNAGDLPEGKTPDDLEAEGMLLVDTGGGRLDTHILEGDAREGAVGEDLSAAVLVARDLDLDRAPRLGQLLAFSARQDARGQSYRNRDPIIHAIGLPGLIRGWGQIHEGNDHQSLEHFMLVMDHLYPVGAEKIESIQKDLSGEVPVRIGSVSLRGRSAVDEVVATWLAGRFVPQESPVQEKGETASRAVARAGGVESQPDLEKILRLAEPDYLREKFAAGGNLRRELRLTLFGVLYGARQRHEENPERVHEVIEPMLESVYVREVDWFLAETDYQDPQKQNRLQLEWGSGPVTLVTVRSESRAILRMARRVDRPDVILWAHPKTKHVSVTLSQFTGRLRTFSLTSLAARFRVAECVRRGEEVPDVDTLMRFGVECGWFLHHSTRILSRGSPKAPDREPTALTPEEMENLIASIFEPDRKVPDTLGCPEDGCTREECPFFRLRLATCFRHRERLRLDSPP